MTSLTFPALLVGILLAVNGDGAWAVTGWGLIALVVYIGVDQIGAYFRRMKGK